MILIVAPAWVGDMVMAHTLVQTLREVHGAARAPEIGMLAPESAAPLAARMPGVSHVHVLPVGHGELGLSRRWRVARSLAGYDQAILLPNSFKSALVPFFAGIPTRTGWVGEGRYGLLNDIRRLDEVALPLMIERFMALGLPPGSTLAGPYPEPELRADAGRAEALRSKLGLGSARPPAVLCPGAEFGPAKRWPETHYAAVARALIDRGQAVWLMGSPKDRDVCEAISGLVGSEHVHVIAGATSLLDAVDLMSLATVVVCNDSGLMHVAAALQRPLIAVFGSTSPDFTPPLSAAARVVRLNLDCSPCFSRTCPLGHLNCLRQLPAERVIEQL